MTSKKSSLDKKRDEKNKAREEENKKTAGDWEHNFYQKKFIKYEEENIKKNLRPDNCFDPKQVHNYINPQLSREELIEQKKLNGEKLNPTDNIILENYLKKKDRDAIEDVENLEKYGINYIPVTKEGKTRKILDILSLLLTKKMNKSNIESICNIFLRLQEKDEFEIISDYAKKYEMQINKMNEIVNSTDMIELQFIKFHNNMPPLNNKQFKKFDDWQIEVINNIDNKISTIISAPTSAGKTVLSGYATTKGRTLIVVPTDPLAWQMASYIGGIIDIDVPIITQTYQTIPRRDEFIEKINSSRVVVGTPDCIVDYLPLIKTNFDWIIFDEIHMIGEKEGSSMELIIKVLNKIPFLALSATIGNIDEIVDWFTRINPARQVKKIVCDKRFFNLQRFYYKPSINTLEMLHPLAMVNVSDFKDGTILNKNLQPTPPVAWSLYEKLINEYGDLGELNHTSYFENTERIHLSKALDFFYDLIEFMISNFDEDKITRIVDSYKNINLNNEEPVDLVKLALLIKQNDKIPAIIFQKNTNACLRIVKKFSKLIDSMENEKYPCLREERIKQYKKAYRLEKNSGVNDEDKKRMQDSENYYLKKNYGITERKKNGKKEVREETNTEDQEKINNITIPAIQEPHKDFYLNSNSIINEGIVEGWEKDCKGFLNKMGSEYHFMIKLLWRGVGVYAKGLPDPYLRLVQTLAHNKQLAIVFSDMSLVFGVSLPFRTVVIYRDPYVKDDLNPMLYHQMAGRAGRRGLDKEGNVIFAGFSWKRIKELSVCPIPNIIGINTLNWFIPHANKLSQIYNNNQDWEEVFNNTLKVEEDDQENIEIIESIKSNYGPDGGWNFAISDDKNHLHMMWKLRNNESETIIASFLIPYLKKGFEHKSPEEINNQVEIAHFLSLFINVKTTQDETKILNPPEIMNTPSFSKIYDLLEELQLDVPKNVDNEIFLSIQRNKVVDKEIDNEMDDLRNRLIDFYDKINAIQHFCFHSKLTNITRLLGKLLTRINWIYLDSSPCSSKSYASFIDESKLKIYSEDDDSQSEEENQSEEDDNNIEV